jgi:hypothetical protein
MAAAAAVGASVVRSRQTPAQIVSPPSQVQTRPRRTARRRRGGRTGRSAGGSPRDRRSRCRTGSGSRSSPAAAPRADLPRRTGEVAAAAVRGALLGAHAGAGAVDQRRHARRKRRPRTRGPRRRPRRTRRSACCCGSGRRSRRAVGETGGAGRGPAAPPRPPPPMPPPPVPPLADPDAGSSSALQPALAAAAPSPTRARERRAGSARDVERRPGNLRMKSLRGEATTTSC